MNSPTPIDTLVQNAHVVVFDERGTVIPDGAIAVKDGVILETGSTVELRERYAPRDRVFASGQIAIPGFTDAHIHTAQTLMRGLLSTLALDKPLRVPTWQEYLVPFEAGLTPDDVYLSGALAYTSMLATGTTSFFESGGPHPDRMAEAAVDTGIRGAVALSTMDGGNRIPGSMTMTTEEALRKNVELVERWPKKQDGSTRVHAGMALRQIITCTPELVKNIHREAKSHGVKVHTHLVEGTYEIDYALENFGKRPIDYLMDIGVFDETLHGAHSILADDRDISLYARHGVSAAHCAKGNYSIGTPPAVRMWRRGVNIGLGTDGVANAGTLDLFRVAMIARVGQSFVEGMPVHNRSGIGLEEPLRMGVVGGARAMAADSYVGTLEAGKRADIVLLRTDSPDAWAYNSPEAFLFECASGRDVDRVFVDGATVVKDGAVVSVDTDEIRAKAAERQKELAKNIA